MDGDNENAMTLQCICQGITLQRAEELLEAASGNLERAIDIFFFQQQDQPTATTIVDQDQVEQSDTPRSVKTPTNGSMVRSPSTVGSHQTKKASPKKKPRQSQLDFGRKQPRLDSHFGFHSQSQRNIHGTGSNDPNDGNPSIDATVTPPEPIAQPATGFTTADIIHVDDDESDHDDNEQTSSPVGPQETEAEASSTTPPLHKGVMKQSSEFPDGESTEISFQHLAETLQQLTDTTKRLVKLDILKEFILHIRNKQQPQSHQPDQIRLQAKTLTCGLYLILGFRGDQPLDVGGSAMTKALQTILGASRMQLSKGYRQYGDLGDAAASLFQKKSYFVSTSSSNATKSLTVLQVYDTFQKIISTDGRDAKQNILLQLLRACNTKIEIRFLVRLLIGNMRVGASLKTILAALAMAFVPPENHKQAIETIQKTHDICPNLESIILALLEGGLEQVQRDCQVQLLTPIAPMLAHPIHSLEQVAKIMTNDNKGPCQPMTMEWKYDGVRCQAHYDGTTMKLFSRHLLETTSQYPDAAQAILDARGNKESVHSFIIDAEIVGVEGEGGPEDRLLPFQDLSRRKKKNDTGQGVRVKVFCFDLMYLNGVSYINESLHVRQSKMKQSFVETSDFLYVSSQDLPTYDEPRICAFLEQAVAKGAEGLMLKVLGSPPLSSLTMLQDDEPKGNDQDAMKSTGTSLGSPYEAGTRSHNWLKVKRDYVAGYADTIDVVPIGAWYGHGRKAQKSFLSPVLLAVYDDEEEVYRSISRCMSFTDAMYDAMREFYFRGTPYPDHVGMEKVTHSNMDNGGTTENLSLTVIPETNMSHGLIKKENDDDDNNNDDDDDDNDDKSSEDDNELDEEIMGSTPSRNNDGIEDGASMVHCFASRPSSAYIVTNESPPIWFRPMEVFEVSFADMSLSKQHTAAAGLVEDELDRGVALRFPRFKRRRPDKKPEQATTSRQIAQLFLQQSKQASKQQQHHQRK